MKSCPKCRSALTKKRRGVYVYEPPHISAKPVLILNASWSYCPTCGYEIIPKALKKGISLLAYGVTTIVDDCDYAFVL